MYLLHVMKMDNIEEGYKSRGVNRFVLVFYWFSKAMKVILSFISYSILSTKFECSKSEMGKPDPLWIVFL